MTYNITLQIKITDGLPSLREEGWVQYASVSVSKKTRCRPANFGGKSLLVRARVSLELVSWGERTIVFYFAASKKIYK